MTRNFRLTSITSCFKFSLEAISKIVLVIPAILNNTYNRFFQNFVSLQLTSFILLIPLRKQSQNTVISIFITILLARLQRQLIPDITLNFRLNSITTCLKFSSDAIQKMVLVILAKLNNTGKRFPQNFVSLQLTSFISLMSLQKQS